MSNRKDLKAFVRYDGTGRVIPGSLILQRKMPKVGDWKQISAYQCCDPSCPIAVYGEDYLIADIIESEAGVLILIDTNPYTGAVLQVGSVLCTSNPPNDLNIINAVTIPAGSVNFEYFLSFDFIETVCQIAFRRVCIDNNSPWTLGVFGPT